jgi:hypothetical protein
MDYPIYEDWQLWLRMEEIGCTFGKCTDAICKVYIRDSGRNSQQDIQQKYYNQILSETKKRRGL